MGTTLQRELAYFESRRPEFLREHAGKFVVIGGETVCGIFDDDLTAFDAGVTSFGDRPFLIKQVLPEDALDLAPAAACGLFHAAP